MRTFFIYLQLEIKRTLKSIPFFLTGAMVLVIFASTIAFSASRILNGKEAMTKIRIGVVLPEDDRLSEKAVAMVASLDSVGSLCSFQYINEKEGKRLLKSGEISALMKIPKRFVQEIINGTNHSVIVVFPEHADIEASVLKELTEAGASILGTSQAAIYGTDRYLEIHGLDSEIVQAEKDLNVIFLRYALSRESYFQTQKVSASGDLSPLEFYGISGAVLVLLLLGIPAAPVIKPYKRVTEQKLTLIGINRWKRTLVRTLSLTGLLLMASSIPYLFCLYHGIFSSGFFCVIMWLLVCFSSAGWILFIYDICDSMTAAILALFFSASIMVFFSGGMIPKIFLPDIVCTIGTWMPTTFMMDAIKWMIQGGSVTAAVKLLRMELLLFILSALARREYE